MARIGKIERKILEIIFRDEERRRNLPREEGEDEEIYYMRMAATYEKALFDELRKDFEEWARRTVPIHPAPANIFERYNHHMQAAKEALKRLLKKGLIKREYVSIRGVTFVGYNLTSKGREAMSGEAADAETVWKALQALGMKGLYRLRMEDIRGKIIEMGGEYWTDKRIGTALKALGVKQVKKRVGGKLMRLYENPAYMRPREPEEGLQVAGLKKPISN